MLCLAWKLDIHKPGKFMCIQRKESVASYLGTSLDLHECALSCCNKRIGAQEANYFHLDPDTSIFYFFLPKAICTSNALFSKHCGKLSLFLGCLYIKIFNGEN